MRLLAAEIADQIILTGTWQQTQTFTNFSIAAYCFAKLTQPQPKPMIVKIINNNLNLNIYGLSGRAVNKDHAGTAFKLMNKMWQTVTGNNLKNKGLNIWALTIYPNF